MKLTLHIIIIIKVYLVYHKYWSVYLAVHFNRISKASKSNYEIIYRDT